MGPERWISSAACYGSHPATFFPASEDGDDPSGRAAKEVCVDCPVILDCLDHAVRHHEVGIWGGTSTATRAVLAVAWHEGYMAYAQAVAAVLAALGRELAGHPDERPVQPEQICRRCGDQIPAGRWPNDTNGPNATCGYTATYNRGCRCKRCRDAKSRHQSRKPAASSS